MEAPKHLPLPDLERLAIERVLRETGGNVGRAARLLGVGRATLYRRLDAPRLQSVVKAARKTGGNAPTPELRARQPLLRDVKNAAIQQALREAGGNVPVAARALGMSRSTLYRKAKGLARSPREPRAAGHPTSSSSASSRPNERSAGTRRRVERAFADAVVELGFARAQALLDELWRKIRGGGR